MLINTHLQAHHSTHSSTRAGLALVAGVALACALFAGPIYAATEAKPSPQKPQREQLTIAAEEATKPWTGDLDGMVKRGFIRGTDGLQQNLLYCRQGRRARARPSTPAACSWRT